MIPSNGLEGDKAELRISGDNILHGVSFAEKRLSMDL
jgi:hypothetical protein